MAKKFPEQSIRKLDPKGMIDERTPPKELKLESFFLSLALLFNDIKGVAIFQKDIGDFYEKPDDKENSHSGEWHGIRLQLTRYLIGHLHEALRLFGANKDVIKSWQFQRYRHKLKQNEKNLLSMIMNVCNMEHSEGYDDAKIESFKKLLTSIRNNIAFHYYQSGKSLVDGFRWHFYKTTGPGTGSAMYSYTKTDFWTNRYYYADAAVMGFIRSEFSKTNIGVDPINEINTMALQIAKVISGLLEGYHDDKPAN